MKRLKVLRETKRARDAVRDIDYAGKLGEAEREWMEIFIAGHYSNDSAAQVALTGSVPAAKAWSKKVNRANKDSSKDVANRSIRLSFAPTSDVEGEEVREYPAISSADFQHYRCTRCCKRSDGCKCPAVQRHKPYGMEDYLPTETSLEEAFADATEALTEKAYDLLPYGTNPEGLKPGHKVDVCLPHHYLKDRSGTVVTYRKWDDTYLIDADRPGLKGRDGTPQAPTTLCWISPKALKRHQLRRAKV